MAGEIQKDGDAAQEKVQAATDRERELRLRRLDISHEIRIRLKISNEQLLRIDSLREQQQRIDDELAGQRSFFE